MGSRRRDLLALAAAAAALLLSCSFRGASASSFGDNFEITGAEDHVKTSADGQTWYLYLDNKTGKGRSMLARYG
jgi:xyloglucan:xyloglucosyl transferase